MLENIAFMNVYNWIKLIVKWRKHLYIYYIYLFIKINIIFFFRNLKKIGKYFSFFYLFIFILYLLNSKCTVILVIYSNNKYRNIEK